MELECLRGPDGKFTIKKSLNLGTLFNLVTDFSDISKSVTKSRVHCTFAGSLQILL